MKRVESSGSRQKAGWTSWWQGDWIPCPDHLRAELDQAMDDRHYREARFLMLLGMPIALMSLLVDAVTIPEHLGMFAFLKLGVVWPMQILALLMPRHRLGTLKLLLGISLILFGCSLAYASFFTPPPSDALRALGVVFLLGIAVPVLPLRRRELLLFEIAYVVPVSLLTFILHREVIFAQVFLPMLVIVAFGAGILERRLRTLERSSTLLTLQAEERARELEISNVRLTKLSMLDPLTDLGNRRFAEVTFENDYATGPDEAPGKTALLLIDLDHFKLFNDRWGHEIGDRCLQAVAEVLRHTAGIHGGFAARYGGEEFMVMLRVDDMAQAREVAEQLRVGVERIEIGHGDGPAPISCTASTGIAVHDGTGRPVLRELTRNADEALYRAKSEGRNRHRIAA